MTLPWIRYWLWLISNIAHLACCNGLFTTRDITSVQGVLLKTNNAIDTIIIQFSTTYHFDKLHILDLFSIFRNSLVILSILFPIIIIYWK